MTKSLPGQDEKGHFRLCWILRALWKFSPGVFCKHCQIEAQMKEYQNTIKLNCEPPVGRGCVVYIYLISLIDEILLSNPDIELGKRVQAENFDFIRDWDGQSLGIDSGCILEKE